MSVPRKYRQLGDFHKYYSGEAVAPVLTVVVGGNHEASNYLFELYHGGWLAPKIYYLGAASVIRYGPWRIAGMSGIYDKNDYNKEHHERLPYSSHDIKSIYHVRRYDIDKLLQIREEVDIGLSHDWPAWVELFGDYQSLYSRKPHFLDSAKRDRLGSYAATEVMNHLRPLHWFSGHMHCRFPANISYASDKFENSVRKLKITQEITSVLPVLKTDKRYFKTTSKPASQRSNGSFLALDKYKGDARGFLELMDLSLSRDDAGVSDDPSHFSRPYKLCYDEEWLAITRACAGTLQLQDRETLVVPPSRARFPSQKAISEHRKWVQENITKRGLLQIPENFMIHAPVFDETELSAHDQPNEYANCQTAQFAELLQIPNVFTLETQDPDVDGNCAGDDFIVFGEQ